MNNNFNFSRFKKVLVYDYYQYIQRFGVVMAVLIGLFTILVWLSSFSFSSWTNSFMDGMEMPGIPAYVRYTSISNAFWIAIFIAPAWLYGFINMKKDGPQYATLPATYLEKFISILFYTLIVTPAVFMIGSFAVDTLLTLLPWGGYKEFIWEMSMNDYIDSTLDFNPMEMFGDYPLWLFNVIGVLSTSSLMFFVSTIFKKHKIAKTIGIIFLLGFVALIAFLASLPSLIEYINNYYTSMPVDYFEEYFIERLLPCIMYSSLVIGVIQTVVCYVWGYHRMKRMKF